MACVDGDFSTIDEQSFETLPDVVLLPISWYVDVTGKIVLQMILLPAWVTGPP